MLTRVPTAQARAKAGPWFWGAALSCLVLFFWLCTVLFPVLFFSGSTSFFGDLVQRSHKEILPRDLLYRYVRRSCQEVSYRDLANRALVEILYRDLARRPLMEILYGDLEKRAEVLLADYFLIA